MNKCSRPHIISHNHFAKPNGKSPQYRLLGTAKYKPKFGHLTIASSVNNRDSMLCIIPTINRIAPRVLPLKIHRLGQSIYMPIIWKIVSTPILQHPRDSPAHHRIPKVRDPTVKMVCAYLHPTPSFLSLTTIPIVRCYHTYFRAPTPRLPSHFVTEYPRHFFRLFCVSLILFSTSTLAM